MGDIVFSESNVHISMLGRFELKLGDKVVTDAINRSHRIWNLLSYIVMHRTRNIPQFELIEAIWPSEENNNPGSTLKTLVYRVRNVLADELGDGVRLILSQRNSYSWNKEYNCVLDVEEFERLFAQANDEKLPDEERIEIYGRATDLYKGDFLPKLADQMWIISISAHYHAVYLNAVKSCAELMLQNEMYNEVVELCGKALAIDPLDEQLYTYLIAGYARQGNDAAALSQYEAATDFLYRNLGVQPSEQLRSVYLEIMKDQKNLETDLGVIQQSIKEPGMDPGAFVCDFGFFREAYRLEARRAARLGTCVHLGLLTVNNSKGKVPPLNVLNKAMEQLLDIILMNLRRGDVVSRYSGAQFIIMLSTANYEDGEMVVARIVSNYARRHPGSAIKIGSKLQQLEFSF